MAIYAWSTLCSFETCWYSQHERWHATIHHIVYFAYSWDLANYSLEYRPKVSWQPGSKTGNKTRTKKEILLEKKNHHIK